MADPVYHAEPADTLRHMSLSGLDVVYHRPSGQTHIMIEPMPDLLATLADRPMRVSELAAFHAVEAEEQPILQQRLDELLAAGLIAAR